MTDEPKAHPHELISALLDGEATVPERAAVDRHLRDCAECRALLGDFRTLATAAAASQPPPVPAGLLAAVRARLEVAGEQAGGPAAARTSRWWTGLWRSPLPATAAAGLMVAVVALWMLRERAAPALHAPPSDAIGIKEEIGAEQAVPGEAPPVAAQPEVKRAASPPKSLPAPAPLAPTPPAAGMVRQEPAPPAPGDDRTAVLKESSGAAGAAEPSGLARSAADLAADFDTLQADAQKQMAASPRPEAVLEVAAAGARTGQGREMRFEFPDYSGSITEGGTIALREGEYVCTAQVGDSSEIRARIAALFSLASAPGPVGEAGQERERNRMPYRISVSAPGRDAAQRDAPRDLPPASVAEIVKRIRELIQGPLRTPLEEQCGRPPGTSGREPAD